MSADAKQRNGREGPSLRGAGQLRFASFLDRLAGAARSSLGRLRMMAGRLLARRRPAQPPAPAPGAETELRPPAPAPGWRAVVDAMPDPALALDVSGIVLHHNAAVVDLFPRVRAGQPITHATRSPELLEAVERARNKDGITIVELRDRIPVMRRVSAMITAIRSDARAGENPLLLVTFRDITDQEKLAQMRADFIAHASHELRTPLASLRGFVETLQGAARNDPAARERFLTIMATQAERMTRLIDDLLSLSRIEMNLHVPPRGIVDLSEAVGFVVQTLEPVARSAGVALTAERLPSPVNVRGDREELLQALQNLVQNAIKYNRPGGRVAVRMSEAPPVRGRGQRVSVAVEDDGPGIAPEHLPRLTERFYRVSAAASREKGGTGLGLAIVKNVVARHRGELEIASKVGAGSTFTVILDEVVAA